MVVYARGTPSNVRHNIASAVAEIHLKCMHHLSDLIMVSGHAEHMRLTDNE